jgi:hypothetical protein
MTKVLNAMKRAVRSYFELCANTYVRRTGDVWVNYLDGTVITAKS